MAGDVVNIKVYRPLKLHSGLTENYQAICHYSYNLPLGVIFQYGIHKAKNYRNFKIERMIAGNLAVINDIKNPPNKIIITCRSKEHGNKIIELIKSARPGETIIL